MKNIMITLSVAFIAFNAFGQKKPAPAPVPVYQKLLSNELKNSPIFQGPLTEDFNGDGKPDYALVLRQKTGKKQLWLYIVYSKDSVYAKQNLGLLTDTTGLALKISPKGGQGISIKPKKHPFNGLLVTCSKFSDLFEYYPDAGKFIMDTEVLAGH